MRPPGPTAYSLRVCKARARGQLTALDSPTGTVPTLLPRVPGPRERTGVPNPPHARLVQGAQAPGLVPSGFTQHPWLPGMGAELASTSPREAEVCPQQPLGLHRAEAACSPHHPDLTQGLRPAPPTC